MTLVRDPSPPQPISRGRLPPWRSSVLGCPGSSPRARSIARACGVLVVEAQDRVGGRTLTAHLDESTFIDDGGQWVSPNQDRIVALAAELGVDLFPSWGEGKMVLVRECERRPSDGLFLPEEGDAADEATRAGKNLAPMAEEVSVDAPWTAPKASEWDAQRLHGWLRDNVASKRARIVLATAIEGCSHATQRLPRCSRRCTRRGAGTRSSRSRRRRIPVRSGASSAARSGSRS
jgi:monoamine oxidase